MFNSCLKKQNKIESLFRTCETADQKYKLLMQLGKKLPTYPESLKTKEYLVSGCQSITYLYGTLQNKVMQFKAHSEALISAGLVSVLIEVYDQEPPEAPLECPPHFLEVLGIGSLLSPGRSQGLANLFLRIQRLSACAIARRNTAELPPPTSSTQPT